MFCSKTGWYKPDGGLKEMSCRVAMLRLQKRGLIRLPAPKKTHFAAGGIKRTADGEPKNPIEIDASLADLVIEPVDAKPPGFSMSSSTGTITWATTAWAVPRCGFSSKPESIWRPFWAFRRRPGG
jgi:hypothetical protein